MKLRLALFCWCMLAGVPSIRAQPAPQTWTFADRESIAGHARFVSDGKVLFHIDSDGTCRVRSLGDLNRESLGGLISYLSQQPKVIFSESEKLEPITSKWDGQRIELIVTAPDHENGMTKANFKYGDERRGFSTSIKNLDTDSLLSIATKYSYSVPRRWTGRPWKVGALEAIHQGRVTIRDIKDDSTEELPIASLEDDLLMLVLEFAQFQGLEFAKKQWTPPPGQDNWRIRFGNTSQHWAFADGQLIEAVLEGVQDGKVHLRSDMRNPKVVTAIRIADLKRDSKLSLAAMVVGQDAKPEIAGIEAAPDENDPAGDEKQPKDLIDLVQDLVQGPKDQGVYKYLRANYHNQPFRIWFKPGGPRNLPTSNFNWGKPPNVKFVQLGQFCHYLPEKNLLIPIVVAHRGHFGANGEPAFGAILPKVSHRLLWGRMLALGKDEQNDLRNPSPLFRVEGILSIEFRQASRAEAGFVRSLGDIRIEKHVLHDLLAINGDGWANKADARILMKGIRISLETPSVREDTTPWMRPDISGTPVSQFYKQTFRANPLQPVE